MDRPSNSQDALGMFDGEIFYACHDDPNCLYLGNATDTEATFLFVDATTGESHYNTVPRHPLVTPEIRREMAMWDAFEADMRQPAKAKVTIFRRLIEGLFS